MSKNTSNLEMVGIVTFLVVVGLVAFILPEIVLAFFAPVAGWIIYRDHEKIARLEKELAARPHQAEA